LCPVIQTINVPFTFLKVNHSFGLEKLVSRTLNGKHATDVLVVELGNVLINGGLQTIASGFLQRINEGWTTGGVGYF
jgi:hypothetical protein